jgi:hypothetical protein
LVRNPYFEFSESEIEEINEKKNTDAGLVATLLSRARMQILRLSMVYALLDKSSNIKNVRLSAALAFWNYCEDSVRYLFETLEFNRRKQKL